jgi:hypothetical protein
MVVEATIRGSTYYIKGALHSGCQVTELPTANPGTVYAYPISIRLCLRFPWPLLSVFSFPVPDFPPFKLALPVVARRARTVFCLDCRRQSLGNIVDRTHGTLATALCDGTSPSRIRFTGTRQWLFVFLVKEAGQAYLNASGPLSGPVFCTARTLRTEVSFSHDVHLAF